MQNGAYGHAKDMDNDMGTDTDMGVDIHYYWTGELIRFHTLIS
jgi:hypothetical protein